MAKIKFLQGNPVAVDLPDGTIHGTIAGKASENIIDMWIVRSSEGDRKKLDQQGYYFSCFIAPSSLIRRI